MQPTCYSHNTDDAGNQNTFMASLKSPSFLPQNADFFFVDSHTTNKHTKIAY
jgi:hypothetical protein